MLGHDSGALRIHTSGEWFLFPSIDKYLHSSLKISLLLNGQELQESLHTMPRCPACSSFTMRRVNTANDLSVLLSEDKEQTWYYLL